MRRAMMILVMGALLLALFAGGVMAATERCASIFSGTDGPDTLKGDRCDNNISGLRGNDVIYGYRGADELYGNQGRDRLYGGKGPDKLYGGRGPDKLYGGKGADRLYGGGGDDRIRSGGLDGKRDLVFCGAGRDFASIAENDRAARNCEVVAVAIE